MFHLGSSYLQLPGLVAVFSRFFPPWRLLSPSSSLSSSSPATDPKAGTTTPPLPLLPSYRLQAFLFTNQGELGSQGYIASLGSPENLLDPGGNQDQCLQYIATNQTQTQAPLQDDSKTMSCPFLQTGLYPLANL